MLNKQATDLVIALAKVWPELPELIGPRWQELETRLLVLLRALDAASDETQAEAAENVLEALEDFPFAYQKVTEKMPRVTKGVVPMRAVGDLEQIVPQRRLIVPVLYATDRQTSGNSTPTGWFSGERASGERGDAISYGVVTVSIPDDHRMGEIERPHWWRLEFREDPSDHVVLLSPMEPPLTRAKFIQRAQAEAAQARVPEALIFVHGFNVTFADAARRTAQIHFDLDFRGLPCMYSWASKGSGFIPKEYFADGDKARLSVPDFHDFLRLVREELGLSNVHVIAHSMGNRVVTEALCPLITDRALKPGAAHLRQLVLAAPDIDARLFLQLAARFYAQADRCTLYASSGDKALIAAAEIVDFPRAGLSGERIVVTDGVDTVDASLVDTGFLKHSYIGDNETILADVRALMLQNQSPDDRKLASIPCGNKRYWFFGPKINPVLP